MHFQYSESKSIRPVVNVHLLIRFISLEFIPLEMRHEKLPIKIIFKEGSQTFFTRKAYIVSSMLFISLVFWYIHFIDVSLCKYIYFLYVVILLCIFLLFPKVTCKKSMLYILCVIIVNYLFYQHMIIISIIT